MYYHSLLRLRLKGSLIVVVVVVVVVAAAVVVVLVYFMLNHFGRDYYIKEANTS